MKKLVACAALAVLLGWAATQLPASSGNRAMAEPVAKPKMLVHDVYFSLKDRSEATRKKLIAACHKHLTGHEGTVFFAVGTPSDLDRPVNDRDWDVALHLVFENRQAHDRYQDAPRHNQFVAENKDLWSKVRVFDTDVAAEK